MAATDAQIAEVQRCCGGLTDADATWPKATVKAYIEEFPLMDELGEEPYTWSGTSPPTKVANPYWIPTYDLAAAAADIWGEKASLLATTQFDITADGSTLNRSQLVKHAQVREMYYRSRRSPTTIRGFKWPKETQYSRNARWILNQAEPDK